MCHGGLAPVFSLQPTPIANAFQEEPDTGEKYPLELMQCAVCRHVQLRHTFEGLFEGYKYSTPQESAPYLQAAARTLVERYQPNNCVEIGSNNGLYTDILHDSGIHTVIGVDPAGTHWASWKCNFDLRTAEKIKDRVGLIDLVVCNNVCAHVDDLDGIFVGIDHLLADNGAVIIEVQDFGEMVNAGIFDTIYHEHVDQHTPGPWRAFLRRFNLKLSRVEQTPVHGGSLRITATRKREVEWSDRPIDWDVYARKVVAVQERVKAAEPRVAWGAAAKLTTMVHQCDLSLDYVVDYTPAKQGLYLPGTGTRIMPDFSGVDSPVLLGAWNYAKIFAEKYDYEAINPYT